VFRRAYGAAYWPSYEVHYEIYQEVASATKYARCSWPPTG
jgi:hypothetical protein